MVNGQPLRTISIHRTPLSALPYYRQSTLRLTWVREAKEEAKEEAEGRRQGKKTPFEVHGGQSRVRRRSWLGSLSVAL